MLRRARAGLARARRRSRRAGHRQHRRRVDAFQTGLDVVQLARRPRGAARAVAAHHATPSCASRPGTTRCASRSSPRSTACAPAADCTSWPTPTSSSRRRAPTFVDPHVSIGQVTRLRDDRAGAEVADGGGHAHGAGRPPRAHSAPSGPTSSGSSARWSIRPSDLRDAGPGAGRDDRPQLAGRDGGHQAGALGRLRARASPTPAGPAPPSWCRCGATPTRPRARPRSPSSASPSGSRSHLSPKDHDDVLHLLVPDRRAPRARSAG